MGFTVLQEKLADREIMLILMVRSQTFSITSP